MCIKVVAVNSTALSGRLPDQVDQILDLLPDPALLLYKHLNLRLIPALDYVEQGNYLRSSGRFHGLNWNNGGLNFVRLANCQEEVI